MIDTEQFIQQYCRIEKIEKTKPAFLASNQLRGVFIRSVYLQQRV